MHFILCDKKSHLILPVFNHCSTKFGYVLAQYYRHIHFCAYFFDLLKGGYLGSIKAECRQYFLQIYLFNLPSKMYTAYAALCKFGVFVYSAPPKIHLRYHLVK